MSILTIYDRRDVLGNSYPGFDNSPDYQNSAWGKFIEAIDTKATVLSSNSSNEYNFNILAYERNQTILKSLNGNTYRIVKIGYSSYEDRESLSVDSRMIFTWIDKNLSVNDINFLAGQQLNEKAFANSDTITGSSMGDIIYGYAGDDALWGNGGDDYLHGGYGDDTLRGGDGDDTLNGDWGGDSFDGGPGTDTVEYYYESNNYGVSVIPSEENKITMLFYAGGQEILTSIEKLSFADGIFSASDFSYIGEYGSWEGAALEPIYRFYNVRDKAFFYTTSLDEKKMIIEKSSPTSSDDWPYIYQGSTFTEAVSYLSSDTLVPLHRFYNSETGHHFFTASESEANLVKEKADSGEWPFNYEGTAFNVYQYDPNSSAAGDELAVHRFYSPSLNRHFFTGDLTEVSNMQLIGIWNYEGIGFWGEVL